METTKFYIELIIVGLETFVWMAIFFINIIEDKILGILYKILNNFSSSLLLIGILYIIGVLMDRLVDSIFQKLENEIRNNSGLETKSAILVWKKHDQEKFADYTRSRIRIIRASIINIPLITISLMWSVFKFYQQEYFAMGYIFILGALFTYVAKKSLNRLLKTYYDKARVFEISDKKIDGN